MSRPEPDLPRCANCGVDIPWRPATYRGMTYCCGGCAQGGPCYCSYDLNERDVPGANARGSIAVRVITRDYAHEAR